MTDPGVIEIPDEDPAPPGSSLAVIDGAVSVLTPDSLGKEPLATKPKRGGFRPGSGRPKGSKNTTTLQLEALAREAAPAAMASLKKLATGASNESARVAAATAILDRAYGKPRQALEHSGEGGGPVEVAITHEIIDPSSAR